jgi:hypothetical protein
VSGRRRYVIFNNALNYNSLLTSFIIKRQQYKHNSLFLAKRFSSFLKFPGNYWKGKDPVEVDKKVVSILNIVFRHNVTATEIIYHERSIKSDAVSYAKKVGDEKLLEMIDGTRIPHALYK